VTENTFYRFLVRVRADFQDFVIVGECSVTQDSCPSRDHSLRKVNPHP
jgi:hypothetical protein